MWSRRQQICKVQQNQGKTSHIMKIISSKRKLFEANWKLRLKWIFNLVFTLHSKPTGTFMWRCLPEDQRFVFNSTERRDFQRSSFLSIRRRWRWFVCVFVVSKRFFSFFSEKTAKKVCYSILLGLVDVWHKFFCWKSSWSFLKQGWRTGDP